MFHTISLISPPKSEIRAGKLLVDPGHLQEELVGGHPHHRNIKARRRHPSVDRGLQKNTRKADDHAKKLPEASVSLKWTVFKLFCPAHLFPNTPRTLYVVNLFSHFKEWLVLCVHRVPFVHPNSSPASAIFNQLILIHGHIDNLYLFLFKDDR